MDSYIIVIILGIVIGYVIRGDKAPETETKVEEKIQEPKVDWEYECKKLQKINKHLQDMLSKREAIGK